MRSPPVENKLAEPAGGSAGQPASGLAMGNRGAKFSTQFDLACESPSVVNELAESAGGSSGQCSTLDHNEHVDTFRKVKPQQ